VAHSIGCLLQWGVRGIALGFDSVNQQGFLKRPKVLLKHLL
jgi:hypothetical protein